MIEQTIKQAYEAVNILDRAAAAAGINRESHVQAQIATQFLRSLLAEEEHHNAAKVPIEPPRLLPAPPAL